MRAADQWASVLLAAKPGRRRPEVESGTETVTVIETPMPHRFALGTGNGGQTKTGSGAGSETGNGSETGSGSDTGQRRRA